MRVFCPLHTVIVAPAEALLQVLAKSGQLYCKIAHVREETESELACALSASGGCVVARQRLCDDHSSDATVSWPAPGGLPITSRGETQQGCQVIQWKGYQHVSCSSRRREPGILL